MYFLIIFSYGCFRRRGNADVPDTKTKGGVEVPVLSERKRVEVKIVNFLWKFICGFFGVALGCLVVLSTFFLYLYLGFSLLMACAAVSPWFFEAVCIFLVLVYFVVVFYFWLKLFCWIESRYFF